VIHSPVADGSIEPRQHRQQSPLNNYLHTTSNLNTLSNNPLSSWWNRRRQLSSSSRHEDDEESDDEVTMRVAITIALPSPEYPIHIENTKDKRQEAAGENLGKQNMTDYCIGTYECPWH
jgi:hypothetical protein